MVLDKLSRRDEVAPGIDNPRRRIRESAPRVRVTTIARGVRSVPVARERLEPSTALVVPSRRAEHRRDPEHSGREDFGREALDRTRETDVLGTHCMEREREIPFQMRSRQRGRSDEKRAVLENSVQCRYRCVQPRIAMTLPGAAPLLLLLVFEQRTTFK